MPTLTPRSLLVVGPLLLVACPVHQAWQDFYEHHGTGQEESSSTGSSSSGSSSTSSGDSDASSDASSGTTVDADGSASGSSGSGSTTDDAATTTTTTGTTAHAPVCGDGIVEADETCDDMNDIPDDGCNNVCARDSVVFISSQVYDGAINGLDGADQRCRMLAAQAQLLRFETFRAWLSTPSSPAADRLLHSRGRYVLVNGLVVAPDWTGLTSGALLHPIDVDEQSQTQDYVAWTGTLADGLPAFGSEFCNDWTSDDSDLSGGSGISYWADAGWSFFEHAYCSFDLHLYCIEQ